MLDNSGKEPPPAAQVAYRLRAMPVLRDEHRTAKILGALARMEIGPVSSTWFASRTGLQHEAAAALLEEICDAGWAQRIAVRPCDPPPPRFTTKGSTAGLDAGAPPSRRSPLRSVFEGLWQLASRKRAWAQVRIGPVSMRARVGGAGRRLGPWLWLALLPAILFGASRADASPACWPESDQSRLCQVGLAPEVIEQISTSQERSNWCWAAAISMALRQQGVTAGQANIVAGWLGKPLDLRLRNTDLTQVVGRRWLRDDGRVVIGKGIVLGERRHLSDEGLTETLLHVLGADRPVLLSAHGHSTLLVAAFYVERPGTSGKEIVGGVVIDPAPGGGPRFLREDEMKPAMLVEIQVAQAR
jgi:hypothetical protein